MHLVNVSQRLVVQMAEMQRMLDSQRRRNPGSTQEAATGDPMLDQNPYFSDAVCRCYSAEEQTWTRSCMPA